MPCGCLFDMIEDILFDMTLFDMTVNSGSSFEMTLVSKSEKFGTTVNSIWRRTVVSKWPRKYDYRFQMTHGSRGLWISPREPNFFAPKFSSWKSGGAVSASWRKRSKVWLSISRREWSNLWLYGFTVENMAICGYGQKFDYRFQDETVGSLAMSFYGRKFGYTRLWSKVCLCLSWRKWRICWRKWWINS